MELFDLGIADLLEIFDLWIADLLEIFDVSILDFLEVFEGTNALFVVPSSDHHHPVDLFTDLDHDL